MKLLVHQKPHHVSTDLCIFDAVSYMQCTLLLLLIIAF